jgi:hypothetical protein
MAITTTDIYDGLTFIGHVVERDKARRFDAFTAAGTALGVFTSPTKAALYGVAAAYAGSVAPTFSDYAITFPCLPEETTVSLAPDAAGNLRQLHRFECVVGGVHFRAEFSQDGATGQMLESDDRLQEAMLGFANAHGWQAPEVTIRSVPSLGTEVTLKGFVPIEGLGVLRGETRFYFRGDHQLQAAVVASPEGYLSRRTIDFFASVEAFP